MKQRLPVSLQWVEGAATSCVQEAHDILLFGAKMLTEHRYTDSRIKYVLIFSI